MPLVDGGPPPGLPSPTSASMPGESSSSSSYTPAVGSGVVSGTNGNVVRPVTGANSVLVGGMPATRLTSMNLQNSSNLTGARVDPSQTKVLILAP